MYFNYYGVFSNIFTPVFPSALLYSIMIQSFDESKS